MNTKIASLVLSILFVSIAGCNSESPEEKHNREMTKALQKGALEPVDWSARNNPPMGKMDAKTGLTANFKKKD